jgi:hypothetical protein
LAVIIGLTANRLAQCETANGPDRGGQPGRDREGVENTAFILQQKPALISVPGLSGIPSAFDQLGCGS